MVRHVDVAVALARRAAAARCLGLAEVSRAARLAPVPHVVGPTLAELVLGGLGEQAVTRHREAEGESDSYHK